MRIAIVIALAACSHRGELHQHYSIEPPVAADAGARGLAVLRVDGVDDPAPLAVRVDGLVLSDPIRGSPIWAPPSWPYFATFALGFGGAFGSDAEARRGGLTSDISMSMHRRFSFAISVGLVMRGGS